MKVEDSNNRKFSDESLQDILYMLQEKCIPKSLCRLTCQSGNSIYLNVNNTLYQRTAEFVSQYVADKEMNYEKNWIVFRKILQNISIGLCDIVS